MCKSRYSSACGGCGETLGFDFSFLARRACAVLLITFPLHLALLTQRLCFCLSSAQALNVSSIVTDLVTSTSASVMTLLDFSAAQTSAATSTEVTKQYSTFIITILMGVTVESTHWTETP